MKSKILSIILILVLGLFIVNYFTMIANINETQNKIDELNKLVRNQKILNSQYDSILDDINLRDFYISIAEDELNYAYIDEIIYYDISGQ